MLVAEEGVLKTLYPHSGHYRPTNQHLRVLLKFLKSLGVDLDALEVDAQRVHKVARPEKRVSAGGGGGLWKSVRCVLWYLCVSLSLASTALASANRLEVSVLA